MGVTGLQKPFKGLDPTTHLSSRLCSRAFRAGLERWTTATPTQSHAGATQPGGAESGEARGSRGGECTLGLPITVHLPLPGTRLPENTRLFVLSTACFIQVSPEQRAKGSEGDFSPKSPCKGNPCVPVIFLVLTSLS